MSPYPPRLHHDALPAWTTFAAAWRGFAVPDTRAPFRFLDLGCGEGLTPCWVARLYPHAEVIGLDASPVHIARSRELADRMGVRVRFEVATFEAPPELPEVDFAMASGVWSWVGDAGRAALVDLLGRVLRPNGLLYLDGQALPGAVDWLPLVHYVRHLAHDGPSLARAIDTLLPHTDQGWLLRYQGALAELRASIDVDPGPALHELLAADWRADLLPDRVAALAGADLVLAGSAHLAQLGDPHDLQALTLLDFVRSVDFRRDVFQRGGARLDPAARQAHLLARRYALTDDPGDDPLLALLDAGPLPGAALVEGLGWAPDVLLDALSVHVGQGRVQPGDLAPFPSDVDDLLAADAELVEVLSPSGIPVGFTADDRAIWLARHDPDLAAGARSRLAALGHAPDQVEAALAAFDPRVTTRAGWPQPPR